MQYLHVKNLEKYHPKYTDRKLHFGKFHFSMVNSDAEFMLLDEIDRWRFIAFVMIELDSGKPVPLDARFLVLKGFDLKKRAISLTIQMLQNLTEVRENPLQNLTVNSISPCLREAKRSEVKLSEAKLDSASRNIPLRSLHLQETDGTFIQGLKKNSAFNGIDIDRELLKMDAWLSAHPLKKKTRRFIVNWLNRIDKPVDLESAGKPLTNAQQHVLQSLKHMEERTK